MYIVWSTIKKKTDEVKTQNASIIYKIQPTLTLLKNKDGANTNNTVFNISKKLHNIFKQPHRVNITTQNALFKISKKCSQCL